MSKNTLNEVVKLIVSILICQFAGFIGSLFTPPAIPKWYTFLIKPPFTPPNWVFAPVWTTLFVLMGVSVYLVWSKGLSDKKVKTSLFIFGIQLVLNALWSLLFFGWRCPVCGFVEIIILWIAITLTILGFFRVSKMAGILLLPYWLWVSFAAVLNFSIWRLNP